MKRALVLAVCILLCAFGLVWWHSQGSAGVRTPTTATTTVPAAQSTTTAPVAVANTVSAAASTSATTTATAGPLNGYTLLRRSRAPQHIS